MKALEFIFYLGIISAVFRFLWAFFIVLLVLIKGSPRKGIFEAYFLKLIKYFLLVSLIAKFSISFGKNESFAVELTYILLGGGILFMYMVGKNEKKQTLLTLQKQFGQAFKSISSSYNARLEWMIIGLSMLYFTISIFFPYILTNPVTEWFKSTIEAIYTTPVIGWIFKLIGAFFLIQILFKGFNAVRILLTGRKASQNQNDDDSSNSFPFFDRDQDNDESDRYDDYEDVSDKEDDDSGNSSESQNRENKEEKS